MLSWGFFRDYYWGGSRVNRVTKVTKVTRVKQPFVI
jgi:hypothetical protein